MAILVIGGTGFIGTRAIRRLAARGEEVAVMDINPVMYLAAAGKYLRLIRRPH
jgi:nucleoside-diphosphate-sugar epimerase